MCITDKGGSYMQRKLLTNGNVFKRTDGRWGGVVWYADEKGERNRKSFSGNTKSQVKDKITSYICDFEKSAEEFTESNKTLLESLNNWLKVFKFPSVEQTTYDRAEGIARNQIYPLLGNKTVGDITAEDIRKILTYWMNKGYAYTTVKKIYMLLNEYYRYLYKEGKISRNPMENENIDIENKTLSVKRGVKEIFKRDGTKATGGNEIKIGKPKTATSKRLIPLNKTALAMIEDLRKESYFGENSPLVSDEKGNYTKPVNFRKRYYRILKAAGIEQKGLHSLRHTFATNLVNGIKQSDGTVKSLSPRQVADLLGHSTSEITERYYVKKDTKRLIGITEGFEM